MSQPLRVCGTCRVRPAVGILFSRDEHLYWKLSCAPVAGRLSSERPYCRECVPEFVIEALRGNGIPLTETKP